MRLQVQQQDFEAALDSAQSRLALVHQNLELFADTVVGTSLHDVAFCHLCVCNFDQAMEYARQAKTCYPAFSWEWQRANSLELKALLFNNNMQQALIAANETINSSEEPLAYSYLSKATVLFQLKDYKGCVEQLELVEAIGHASFGMYLLHFVCGASEFLQIGNRSEVPDNGPILGKMQKQIGEEPNRETAIYELCVSLAKARYDFSSLLADHARSIRTLLLSDDKKWSPTGSEYIVFEHWLQAASRQQAYRFLAGNELSPLDI